MYPTILQELIDELARLPGIGRKTATRLSIHILAAPDVETTALANAIIKLKKNIRFCVECFNLTEDERCSICQDPTRDRSLICVVEDATNIELVEKTNEYKGLFHVLGGVISPLDGISPDDLQIKSLINRLEGVREVILALNPSTEGEATSIYLSRLIKPLGIKISRLARGIPLGSSLEFVDELTLSKALKARNEI